MRYPFHTVDVFTDRIFGGNPLAVLPYAQDLDTEQMQSIAREFNLSETTFVTAPQPTDDRFRVRIFTPSTEIPFAGHPTLGTAFVLAAMGRIPLAEATTRIVLEERVGPVPVTIRRENGSPSFVQLETAQLPEAGPEPPPAAEIARMLSLDPTDLVAGEHAPEAFSCGLPFLFVPLRSLAAVRSTRLDLVRWQRVLADYWAPHVVIFSVETEHPGSDVHVRMFAPGAGVAEDPATGSAAAALAGYLGARAPVGDDMLRWTIEQGIELGRPSRLEVEADRSDGRITKVRVGGRAVLVSSGEMEIPQRR